MSRQLKDKRFAVAQSSRAQEGQGRPSVRSLPTEHSHRVRGQETQTEKTVLSSLSLFDSVQAPRPQGGTFNPI